MEDSFYTELKSWVAEKLDQGDIEKDILSCLRGFGKLAIEDYEKEVGVEKITQEDEAFE